MSNYYQCPKCHRVGQPSPGSEILARATAYCNCLGGFDDSPEGTCWHKMEPVTVTPATPAPEPYKVKPGAPNDGDRVWTRDGLSMAGWQFRGPALRHWDRRPDLDTVLPQSKLMACLGTDAEFLARVNAREKEYTAFRDMLCDAIERGTV